MDYNIIQNKTYGPRALFYLLTPNEVGVYKPGDKTPVLESMTSDLMVLMIFAEWLYFYFVKKQTVDMNEGIASIAQGSSLLIMKILALNKLFEIPWLHYCYSNLRIIDLPQEFWSTWTGYIYAALVIEFWYYWHHRISHECAFFWTFHQVHHTSQYYFLTTALRQSMFHGLVSFIEYGIMGILGVPPVQIAMHTSLNLLYQFWIHTNLIDRMPVLFEFIFNTPSHHRLHHGRNRDCIDCNYGGLLIIYDRLFRTFRQEHSYNRCNSLDSKGEIIPGKSEPIAYGLVENVNSYRFSYIQLNKTFKNIMMAVSEFPGKSFYALFYGPGYDLENLKGHRLGNRGNCPEIEKPELIYRPKYETKSNRSPSSIFIISISTLLYSNVATKLLENRSSDQLGEHGKNFFALTAVLCIEMITFHVNGDSKKGFGSFVLMVFISFLYYLTLENMTFFLSGCLIGLVSLII